MNENEPQKMQVSKAKRDAILDLVSLGVFTGMVLFVLYPDAFDWVTSKANEKLNKLTYRLSVWQTKLSIRSLPETDES